MRTKIPKFQTKLFLRNGYDFLTEWNFVFTHRFSEISKLIQIINHVKAHSSYFTGTTRVISERNFPSPSMKFFYDIVYRPRESQKRFQPRFGPIRGSARHLKTENGLKRKKWYQPRHNLVSYRTLEEARFQTLNSIKSALILSLFTWI